MATLPAVACLVVFLVTVVGRASTHDESQCADAAARNAMSTLGGRSRVMTVLMNFVKCLQRASNDLYKLINDILNELTGCLAKGELIDVVKCMVTDSGMKKISALVMRTMDVVKCALE